MCRWMCTCMLLLGVAVVAHSQAPQQHLMFVSHLGRSHMIPYLEVLQPLAERGHRVSIVTDKASAAWLRPSYPLFELQFVPDAIDEHMAAIRKTVLQQMSAPPARTGFVMILVKYTLPTYPILAEYLREVYTSNRPDMLVCDWMIEPCADMADTFGIKYAVTLSGVPPGVGEAPYLTNWYNPYPHSTTLHMSLWQRFVTSFVVPAGSFAAMHKPLKQLAKLKQQCGVQAPQGPPSTRYAHALKMINTFTGFESARPLDPTALIIGPIRSHVNSTVPPAIQGWLSDLAAKTAGSNDHTPRVIYIAFGTHVDPPPPLLQHLSAALLATLNAGYADGVIWAVSNIQRDKFPAAIEHDERVLLLPFAPQKALLAHPYVSLFISHGGAESSHEAMYEGVPMLVISFFGDQPMNGVKLQEAGMAETLRYHLVTTDRVQPLLFQMLDPATAEPYRAAAQKREALVRAHVSTNTAAAANLLEFFSQYGWDHLIPAGSKMPWYKASNADLYAAVAAAALVMLAAVGLLLRAVVRLIGWLIARGSSSSNVSCNGHCAQEAAVLLEGKAATPGGSGVDDTLSRHQTECGQTSSKACSSSQAVRWSWPRFSSFGKAGQHLKASAYEIKAKAA